MTTESDGRELSRRANFAIRVVLGVGAFVALALLVFILVATGSSMKDAISPPDRVPVAASPATPTEAGGTTDDGATDSSGETDDAELIAAGRNLTATCVACHSTNGTDGVGPTWSGLLGSERTFVDGSTKTADRAYLLESILDPGTKVVDGFNDGIMPATLGDTFSADELDALVAYLSSL